jgi:hypothetical protein
LMIGRWVFRAARNIVAVLAVVLGLAICVGTGVVLVLGAITLAANVAFALVFGLVYIVAGEAGLAHTHAFLDAYAGR